MAAETDAKLWIEAPGYMVIVKRDGEAAWSKEYGTYREAAQAANGWHKEFTGQKIEPVPAMTIENVYEKRLTYAGFGQGTAEIGIVAYHPEGCVCPDCGVIDFERLAGS